MPLEMSTKRGSDRGPGLYKIGDAVAELMASYEFALEIESGEPEVAESELELCYS